MKILTLKIILILSKRVLFSSKNRIKKILGLRINRNQRNISILNKILNSKKFLLILIRLRDKEEQKESISVIGYKPLFP